LRQRRRAHDRSGERASRAVVRLDVEECTDDGDVSPPGPGLVLPEEIIRRGVDAQAACDMLDDRRRDLADEHEVAESLERLEEDQEAQPRPWTWQRADGEGEFLRGRRIDL